MRIGYWTTSCLQPDIEAVSKEVYQLAARFRGSFIFGISPHYLFRAEWQNRAIGFNNKFDPALRIIIPVVESIFDISHVYGEPTPWTFYKSLRSKRMLLTIASEKGAPKTDFMDRCRKIIVQSKSFFQMLRNRGIEAKRLELLYPGIDLERFRPLEITRQRPDKPKILFATAPRSEDEMQPRGVYLLIEAAKMSPEIAYHLLYREWRNGYTSLAATQKWLSSQRLPNVSLSNGVVGEMSRMYQEYDFTIVPYTAADGGKECPLSAQEGLACGLPALVSSLAPFAEFVAEHRCGVVFDPHPQSLVRAVEMALGQYPQLSRNAVDVARRYFSLERMLRRMKDIYEEIAAH